MKVLVLLMFGLFFANSVAAQDKTAQKADTQPVKQALKVLPKEYKVPEDVIRYVVVDRDFPTATAEWKKAVSQKLAFTSTGDNHIFVNIEVLSPDGKKGQDPYTAAIQWRKYGMPVSPATYIIAAILAHEYYGHGSGCQEVATICEDETRALKIEKEVYSYFMEHSSQFDEVNNRAGYNPELYFDQLQGLLDRYATR